MRFMLIAKVDKDAAGPPDPRLIAAIDRLSDDMTKSGVLLEAGGLPSPTAPIAEIVPDRKGTHIQLGGGFVTVTDGPFTELKELIGGYAVVQVRSKDEAIELGRRFMRLHKEILGPSCTASSEIRQLRDASGNGSAAKR